MEESKDNNQMCLVRGRAGELADKCNLLTFDLISKIFGYKGPFRETLKEFGVVPKDIPDDYVIYKDGIVYTDLKKESEIIWGNYPYELLNVNGSVKQTFKLKGSPKLFIIKTLRELDIFVNINKFTETANKKYKAFSDKLNKVNYEGHARYEDFLKDYKDVIYVSYLYETLFSYQGHVENKKYNSEWDYLLNDSNTLEKYYSIPNGFYLGSEIDIKPGNNTLGFIPDNLPEPSMSNNLQRAQIKLQCLKNNLRLKTGMYLYFVNLSLMKKAADKQMHDFDNIKLTDLEK